jgi:hypothetical protein
MDIVMDYFLNEKQMTEIVATRADNKLSKHKDIRNELKNWIRTRIYNTDNPLVINGYSAHDIYNLAPFMDGIGVFNFMVTLREDPEKAKMYIDDGFKRK